MHEAKLSLKKKRSSKEGHAGIDGKGDVA